MYIFFFLQMNILSLYIFLLSLVCGSPHALRSSSFCACTCCFQGLTPMCEAGHRPSVSPFIIREASRLHPMEATKVLKHSLFLSLFPSHLLFLSFSSHTLFNSSDPCGFFPLPSNPSHIVKSFHLYIKPFNS